MSSRFFPSRLQTPEKFTKLIPISFNLNGSSNPVFNATSPLPIGVKSVTNSAGTYTITLSDQYKSLVSATATAQLASSSSSATAAHKTIGTSTAVFTVTAGANSPGVLGNNLTVTVVQSVLASLKIGSTNSITVTAGSNYLGAAGTNITVQVLAGTGTLGVTTNGTAIVIQLDTGGTTPAAIQTAFNAAIDTGMAQITAITGSSAITAASGLTPLAGDVGWGSTTFVYTDGTNMTVYLPVTIATNAPLAASGATVASAINAQVTTGYAVASAGGAGTIVPASVVSLAGGSSATSAAVAQLGAIDVSSASTVVVRVVDPQSGSVVAVPAATGNVCNVNLVVRTQ